MPYIRQDQRADIDKFLDSFVTRINFRILGNGAVNYVITRILLARNPSSYDEYMALIGTLECVKLELYRRAVGPYEDKKKEMNGDVYP